MCQTGDVLTVAEAARLLETTEMRVLMMLRNQELAGTQQGDSWLVEKVSLELCGKPKPSGIVGCGGGCRGGCGGH